MHMITELLSGYVLLPGDKGREGDHMHNIGLSGYHEEAGGVGGMQGDGKCIM